MEIDDIILEARYVAEYGYEENDPCRIALAEEKSLLALVQSGDEAGQQAWSDAAKAGQVMRIC